MNSRFTKLAGGAFALAVVLGACKKDEVQVTLSPTSTPTLAASTNTVVLTYADSAKTAVTFNWAPIAGFNWTNTTSTRNLPVTYTLQLDKKGNNFATPVNLDAGAGPNTAVSVAALDAALLQLGLSTGKATDVEVRLRSLYANNSPLYTASVPLSATVYKYCAQPAKAWGIVGPGGPGWPGGKIDYVMTYDCDKQTYTYTGPLTTDVIKFRFAYHWKTNLGGPSGSPDPTPIVTTGNGQLAVGGPNLLVSKAGTYTVTLYNAADTTKLSTAYYTIQ